MASLNKLSILGFLALLVVAIADIDTEDAQDEDETMNELLAQMELEEGGEYAHVPSNPFNTNEINKDPARFQETPNDAGTKNSIGSASKRTISRVFRTMFPPKKVEELVAKGTDARRDTGNAFVGKRRTQTHSEQAHCVSFMKDQEVQETEEMSGKSDDPKTSRRSTDDGHVKSAAINENHPYWIRKRWNFRPKSMQFLDSLKDDQETGPNSNVKFIGKRSEESNKEMSKRWGFRPKSIQNLDSLLKSGNSETSPEVKFIGKRADITQMDGKLDKRWNFRPKTLSLLDSIMSDDDKASDSGMKFVGKRARNQDQSAGKYNRKNKSTWQKRWTLRPNSVRLLDIVLPGEEASKSDMRFIGKRYDDANIINKRWSFRPKSLHILENLASNESTKNQDMKFIGKRDSLSYKTKSQRDKFILDTVLKILLDHEDKRRAPSFVGKREDDKRARFFVGKKDPEDSLYDSEKRARMFVGKKDYTWPYPLDRNSRRLFVGKRTGSRMFVGKREDEDDLDKRARMFVGKRARMFVGKRYDDKRARMFVGKRDDELTNEEMDKRARMFVGKRMGDDHLLESLKRSRMFVGKRGRMFVGKRDDDLWDDEKRARMFVGKRFSDFEEDKRARMFVGKRPADYFYDDDEDDEKRARMFVGKRGRMFVGKREPTLDDLLDEEKRARMFVGKRPFSSDDEKRARVFVGKRLNDLADSLDNIVRRSADGPSLHNEIAADGDQESIAKSNKAETRS